MHDGVPFGRFVLVRKLGSGGMGELFLARPREAGKLPPRVALKRIHPEHRGDAAFAQSLVDEAVIGVQLAHPHICRVYEVGEVDGDVYVAMEYVEGESLAALIRRASESGSPCPWPVAVRVGVELAAALEYLHRAKDAGGNPLNLVHRDVSPGNVMLDGEGAVRLIDFGIARASVARSGTRPGEIKANVDWAAPEQLNGVATDARADLWGAGACVFALLTGAAAPRERPLSAVRSDVPEALAALIEACLRTVPADRPKDATALRAQLEGLEPAPREEVSRWVKTLGGAKPSDDASPPAPAPPTTAALPRTAPSRPVARAERFQPGDTLARSTILGRYGGGGMGELWLARQAGSGQFEKTVLLKTISGEVARSQPFVRMFLEEARLAALINHPNVVQVFDCGEERGCWYLAMEYLDGRDLVHVARALKARGEAFPPHVAARVAAECAAGLDFAHRLADPRGQPLKLVHRDVTPDNVVLTYSGQVKLIDFGIAKAVGGEGQTQVGTFKGKLAYASPEQVEGRALDARADVWSLGVVLYELCTGRLPFSAATDHELMRSILNAAPTPPEVEPTLAKIVLRALHKDPARRHAAAATLRSELEAWLATQPPSSTYHLAAMMERLFPVSDAFRKRVGALLAGQRADALADDSTARTVVASSEPKPRPRRAGPALVATGLIAIAAATTWSTREMWASPPPQPAPPPLMISDPDPDPGAANEPEPEPEAVPVPEKPEPNPQSAKLQITCNVPCDIYLDGRKAGRAPLSLTPRPGKHSLRALSTTAGKGERALSLDLDPGESTSRKLTFATGSLVVRAVPWAEVTVDGKAVGQTPLPKLELFEGKHDLVFKNPELKATQRRSVLIKPGESQELSVTLGP